MGARCGLNSFRLGFCGSNAGPTSGTHAEHFDLPDHSRVAWSSAPGAPLFRDQMKDLPGWWAKPPDPSNDLVADVMLALKDWAPKLSGPGELLETIRHWDFLLINDHEARLLAGENNLRKAAEKILDMGPHTLVIKRGEYGAMLFRRDSYFIVPGYLLENVFDPTGAGDAFAGGFIGYLAEHGFSLEGDHISRGMLSRAVIYGSVMGSFCCERFGVERFRTLTREEIDARFEEFRKFTSF